jgi:DNA-binding transcriptional LysR family regulator
MDLRQLRYFSAIAARSSFRRAAEDVHVAQPALSQRIRKLEAELGVTLFDRERRPVALSDAGMALLPRAHHILYEVERTQALIREFGTEFRGQLSVAMMQYLTVLEFPSLLMEFKARHPAVEIQLMVGHTGQVLDWVRQGVPDLGICYIDGLNGDEKLAVEGLRSEQLVLVVAPSNPIGALPSVTISDLIDAPFIATPSGSSMRAELERMFEDHSAVVNVTIETGDVTAILALVGRGFGVAILPRSVADAHPLGRTVASVPFGPVPLTRTIGMVWLTDKHRSRALEAFQLNARNFIASA